MALKFPSELSSRGAVKVTDKLMIHNIDTGATEYTTVSELLTALSNFSITKSVSGSGHGLTIENSADAAGTYTFLQIKVPYSGGAGSTVVDLKVDDAKLLTLSNDFGNILISPFGNFLIANIAEHADNTAAVTAGLAAGTLYRTGDVLKIVHA